MSPQHEFCYEFILQGIHQHIRNGVISLPLCLKDFEIQFKVGLL